MLEARKPGATLIPVIVATDRTQVTRFGSKTVYPFYVTIGNIPKDIRCKPSQRAQILLAYLPDTKLKHHTNKASRRRALTNLFHFCLRRILSPLERVAVEGMVVTSGDGIQRRGHPVFALFVGDYPEQTLVVGSKFGECPKCQVTHDELGSDSAPLIPRDLDKVQDALATVDTCPAQYAAVCRDARVKPIYHPFWENLPYSNIYESIVPDILHQMRQGTIKHLVSWLKAAYGRAEIDARCQCLPPNRKVRAFKHGITSLTHVTGGEHNDMSRLLLGIIVDAPILGGHNSARLLRAVRGLLDFITISQYPIHSSDSLQSLDDALRLFHDNKGIFVDLGIREHFNIPKFHSCRHYATAISLYGTTDNYDTQFTERLHIDLAKRAYKASNARDELFQMTTWVERTEKILQQDQFISGSPAGTNRLVNNQLPVLQPTRYIRMTKAPTRRAVTLDSIAIDYGATYIRDALAQYIVGLISPTFTRAQVERHSHYVILPFLTLPVYHRIKFYDEKASVVDAIHVQPSQKDKRGRTIPARFDTALIDVSTDDRRGTKNIHGMYPTSIASASSMILNFFSRFPGCSSARNFLPGTQSHSATISQAYHSSQTPCLCGMVHEIPGAA